MSLYQISCSCSECPLVLICNERPRCETHSVIIVLRLLFPTASISRCLSFLVVGSAVVWVSAAMQGIMGEFVMEVKEERKKARDVAKLSHLR